MADDKHPEYRLVTKDETNSWTVHTFEFSLALTCPDKFVGDGGDIFAVVAQGHPLTSFASWVCLWFLQVHLQSSR